MKKYLYHVTTNDKAKQILKEGLKPLIGKNQNLIGDKSKAIFLCNRKDIGKWKIQLNADTVLRVDMTGIIDDTETLEYCNGDHMEYSYKKAIPSERIARSIIKETKQDMIDLCVHYIGVLSMITVQCAYYYNGWQITENKENDFDNTKDQLNIIYNILLNLDFSCIEGDELRNELLSLADKGFFTMVDFYKNTRVRLWQQLRLYPHDDMTELRIKVYNYIRKYIWHKISRVNTGDWTS